MAAGTIILENMTGSSIVLGGALVGPQGKDGVVGPQGLQGESFRYLGDWDAGQAYYGAGNPYISVVTHNTKTYIAIASGNSHEPGTLDGNSYWSVIAGDLPSATGAVIGGIKLANDLGGTAVAPQVKFAHFDASGFIVTTTDGQLGVATVTPDFAWQITPIGGLSRTLVELLVLGYI